MPEKSYSNERLMDMAVKARELAYAGISGFKVGAALLTSGGRVFTGCNIEDPSGIGITNICAERCAAVKAISEGCTDFAAIAVAGGRAEPGDCLPCGACRQYLSGFSPQMTVIALEGGEIAEHRLGDLLPKAFDAVGLGDCGSSPQ